MRSIRYIFLLYFYTILGRRSSLAHGSRDNKVRFELINGEIVTSHAMNKNISEYFDFREKFNTDNIKMSDSIFNIDQKQSNSIKNAPKDRISINRNTLTHSNLQSIGTNISEEKAIAPIILHEIKDEKMFRLYEKFLGENYISDEYEITEDTFFIFSSCIKFFITEKTCLY